MASSNIFQSDSHGESTQDPNNEASGAVGPADLLIGGPLDLVSTGMPWDSTEPTGLSWDGASVAELLATLRSDDSLGPDNVQTTVDEYHKPSDATSYPSQSQFPSQSFGQSLEHAQANFSTDTSIFSVPSQGNYQSPDLPSLCWELLSNGPVKVLVRI